MCDAADAETSSDDEKPVVTVDTWLKQAEVKTTFECQEVTSNGYTYLRSVFQLHSRILLHNIFYFFDILLCYLR